MKLTAGLVVGEVSGENLAVPLLAALSRYFEPLEFKGVLGEKLISVGGEALFPMDRLSVVGLIEPLFRIPELFRIRRSLIQTFLKQPPDVFIGVDAPDFNLGLERILKNRGIPTVHYVSPTVWAWRQGRIHKIKQAVDLMLALFPFEAQFYEKHGVPVCFTGHPLADQIPLESEAETRERGRLAKQTLGFSKDQPVLALLPGSRDREILTLGEIYLKTAHWCYARNPQLQLVVPLVRPSHRQMFLELQRKIAPELPIQVLENNTRLALEACDVALVKAGTATLEVMLHKKPMVVSYRVNALTYQLLKRLVKVPWSALPNLLAEEQLVPEFLQEDMQPEKMGAALLALLGEEALPLHYHPSRIQMVNNLMRNQKPRVSINRSEMIERFSELHAVLRRGASDRAAEAIAGLF